METHRIYKTAVRGWENSHSYCRMRAKEKPLYATSPYDTDLRFRQEFNRLAATIGTDLLRDRSALIIGAGQSPQEAGLVLAFPHVAEVNVVEWHEQNFEYLQEVISAWEGKDPDFKKVRLHLSDAANMAGIKSSAIHLVYLRDVIEHVETIEGYTYPERLPIKVLDIFREIHRVLAPGGVLFALDLQVGPQLEDQLDRLGIARLDRDIWRKVA